MNNLRNRLYSRLGLSLNKQRNFPLSIQENPEDCGPTCLKMISEYYSKNIDKKEIQILSKMGANGTSLLHLSEAAENMGFRSLGIKVTFTQFLDIPFPAIIHWKSHYFSIVYRATNRKVWIADPGIGKLILSKKEFCDHWLNKNNLGVALLFELKN